MEHLPQPHISVFSQLEVPYLHERCPFIALYDNQGFSDFPGRSHWNKDKFREGDFDQRRGEPIDSVVCFIQQWLYFGLLSASFGHVHSPQSLVRDFTKVGANGNTAITTQKLPLYLRMWKESIDGMVPNERKSTENSLDLVLAEAQQHVATYMTSGGTWSAASPLSSYPEIGLSVMALGIVLTRAKMRIWGENSKGFTWGHSELTISLMREAGWCPSDIVMLQKRLTASGLYFASLFPPRLSEKQHTEEGCNEDACSVMNVTRHHRSKYTTDHTESCNCQCSYHPAKIEQLCSSFSQPKTIPAFKFVSEVERDERLVMVNICLEKAERYVAISHIWIEGLENIHANAMPRCQVRRLQLLVSEVCGVTDAAQSIPFWIDTLCVPQDNLLPRLRPFRERAIYSMNEVYEHAHTVLVLDKAMMKTSKSATIEEQMMCFACCSWLRRLWTLQEGVLGNKVMLQLSDGAIDMVQDVMDNLRNGSAFFELHQTILTELVEFFWRIQLLREPSGGPKITKL